MGRKIHMLNARDNVIMQMVSKLNSNMYEEINNEFELLDITLKNKGIDYKDLSKALIPLRDEDKYEYAFVFNSLYFKDITMFYGEKIINKILSIINKESTQSIFIGDYVCVEYARPEILKEIFLEKIEYVNECEYVYCDQFFIVYINNITKNQVNNMIEELKKEEYFVGVINMKYPSKIKQYLAPILSPICIKHKNKVIVAHMYGRDDSLNYCEQDYQYKENGFEIISVNEMLYDLFLAYKIPSGMRDEDDLRFSYTLLIKMAPQYDDLNVVVDEKKLEYLNKNKAGSMQVLGLTDITKEELEKEIRINLYNNYIYNIEKNEYGDFKFNVLVDLFTKDNKVKNALISLKYITDSNELRLITMF